MNSALFQVPSQHWHHCLFSVDSLLRAEFDTFEFESELDNDEDATRCIVNLQHYPVLIGDIWHDELPLNLAVVGQIQPSGGFVRCRRRFNPPPNVTATTVFNLGATGNPVARELWGRTIGALRRVAELAGEDGNPADMSQLLVEIGETTVIRLHGRHICTTGKSVHSLFRCIRFSCADAAITEATRLPDIHCPGCRGEFDARQSDSRPCSRPGCLRPPLYSSHLWTSIGACYHCQPHTRLVSWPDLLYYLLVCYNCTARVK